MYEVDVCGLCHIVTFLEDSFLESMWTQRGAQGSGRQEISSVRTEEPRVTKPPSPYHTITKYALVQGTLQGNLLSKP